MRERYTQGPWAGIRAGEKDKYTQTGGYENRCEINTDLWVIGTAVALAQE